MRSLLALLALLPACASTPEPALESTAQSSAENSTPTYPSRSFAPLIDVAYFSGLQGRIELRDGVPWLVLHPHGTQLGRPLHRAIPVMPLPAPVDTCLADWTPRGRAMVLPFFASTDTARGDQVTEALLVLDETVTVVTRRERCIAIHPLPHSVGANPWGSSPPAVAASHTHRCGVDADVELPISDLLPELAGAHDDDEAPTFALSSDEATIQFANGSVSTGFRQAATFRGVEVQTRHDPDRVTPDWALDKPDTLANDRLHERQLVLERLVDDGPFSNLRVRANEYGIVESTHFRTRFEWVTVPLAPTDSGHAHPAPDSGWSAPLRTASLRITTANETDAGRDAIADDGASHTFASLYRLPSGWLSGHGEVSGDARDFERLHTLRDQVRDRWRLVTDEGQRLDFQLDTLAGLRSEPIEIPGTQAPPQPPPPPAVSLRWTPRSPPSVVSLSGLQVELGVNDGKIVFVLRSPNGTRREVPVAALDRDLELDSVTAQIVDAPSLAAAFEVSVSAFLPSPGGGQFFGSCAFIVSTLDQPRAMDRDVYRTQCHIEPPTATRR